MLIAPGATILWDLAAFTGLDLSPNISLTTLVNQPATQSTGARVIPFDADNSVLLQRITGVGFSSVVGSIMPPPSPVTPALSSHDQGLIKVWIMMGAMDNNGAVQAPQAPPSKQYTRNAFLNDNTGRFDTGRNFSRDGHGDSGIGYGDKKTDRHGSYFQFDRHKYHLPLSISMTQMPTTTALHLWFPSPRRHPAHGPSLRRLPVKRRADEQIHLRRVLHQCRHIR